MDHANRINLLRELVGRVAEARPDTAGLCAVAERSIAASGRRACMDEPKVSASARASVGAAAMAFVSGVLSEGPATRAVAFLLASIAAEAAALAAGNAPPEHLRPIEAVRPQGWQGDSHGPFFLDLDDGIRLTLARRPRLPGGDWTVYYGPVPAAFGETPERAAAMADALCAALSSGRLSGKTPPSRRAANRALTAEGRVL